jgi:hypothetical protein
MTKYYEDPLGPDATLTPPVERTGLSPERRRLFDCVGKINQAWIESMREMRRAEAESSVHLFSCKTAEEALSICERWLARRQEIQKEEQRLFDNSWADLKALLTHSSRAVHRSDKDSSDAGAERHP